MSAVQQSPARVDIGALAGEIVREASTRIADAIVCADDWLREDGNELGQTQKAQLFQAVLRMFDGFERTVYRTLRSDLRRAGVEVWGASKELQDA